MVAYAERFYRRQFITRKITNHHILHQVEEILTTYLNNEALLAEGLPTVRYFADALNISAKYLSSLLNSRMLYKGSLTSFFTIW